MSASPNITFATAFYRMPSKFPSATYIQWAKNLFSIVQDFYLVVFTDETTFMTLLEMAQKNPNIRVVVRPFAEFKGIQHRDFWIKNHEQNTLLNRRTCWELNMLWNEKVWMVKDVIEKQFLPKTEYYGWMDIGYFRNNLENISTEKIRGWAHPTRVASFSEQRVHYVLVNPIGLELNQHLRSVGGNVPPNQVSVAGGFFFGGRNAVLNWCNTYVAKLNHYITTGALVKDDQIVVVDCVMDDMDSNRCLIQLHSSAELLEGKHSVCSCTECNRAKIMDAIYRQSPLVNLIGGSPFPCTCCRTSEMDDWFLFQRLLMHDPHNYKGQHAKIKDEYLKRIGAKNA